MPEPTWPEWAKKHATTFGMTSDAELSMLGEWCEVFRHAGLTPSVMIAATRHVAAHDPPRFRSDHLPALHRAADAIRRAETTSGPPSTSDRSCGLCGGTGLVIRLPCLRHLGAWRRGDWRQAYTTCASCRCGLGRWLHNQEQRRTGKPGALMTYDQYAAACPDWRELVERQRQWLLAGARASSTAGGLDRAMGAILARARGRAE